MLINRPNQGTYIGVEGPKGVGKTFTTNEVADEYGMTTIPDEVPDGWGKRIKQTLSTDDVYNRDGYPVVEGLQFLSYRLIELQEYVVPQLRSGESVFHDRAFYSTPVYCALIHSKGRGSDDVREHFEDLCEIASHLAFSPDLTIYLHDSFDNCLDRLESREGRSYEQDEIEMMRTVHEYYPRLLDGRDDVSQFHLDEYDSHEQLVGDIGRTVQAIEDRE